jgi:CheY-like chemotaxis protein
MTEGRTRRLFVLGLGDDTARGKIVLEYLASAGYDSSVASIEDTAGEKPLGIVLDVSPCSSDCWGLLLQLKSDPQTRDIPILPVYLSEEGKVGGVFPVADFFILPADTNHLSHKLTVLGLTDEVEMWDLQVMMISRKGEEAVAKSVSSLGFEIVNAYTGKEGYALATITPPYMAFTQLMLPDMSSFELMERFRLYPQTKNVPFFILVKDSLKDGEKKAVSREISHLVRKKELTKDEFLAAFRRRA